MTEWVLIAMICARNCYPQYATIYPTKKECVAKITSPDSSWTLPSHYCIPLIKVKND